MHLELYTRDGCHLCDDAHQLLRSYGIEPEVIDIDANPQFLAEYNECVPVVRIDGKVRFRGKVDRRLLERLLIVEP
jgi:glutaredoxin